MTGLGKFSTKVDDNVVIYLLVANPSAILSCRESCNICIKPIAIAQKLNSPFLHRDEEVDPTAPVTKFRKGHDAIFCMIHASAVEFFLKLRFRWRLDCGTKRSFCRQVEWNEFVNHFDDEVDNTVFGDDGLILITQ